MAKEKPAVWSKIFAAELKWPRASSAATARDRESHSHPQRWLRRRPVIVRATLVAALAAIPVSGAFADKGGRPYRGALPDVNMGLAGLQNLGAGVGPFVPSANLSVSPGLMRGPLGSHGNMMNPAASSLTPAAGLPAPGKPGNPGLHLGRETSDGAGKVDDLPAVANASLERVASTESGSSAESSLNDTTLPRRIPVCR